MITNPSDPRDTVIVGAGGLGQKLAKAIGVHVVAFADNDMAKHRPHDIVPTISFPEAVTRYPDARYVIAIWGGNSAHRIAATERELHRFGVWRTEPVGRVLGALGHTHYWLAPIGRFTNEVPRMLDGADLWADRLSQRTYLENLSARLLADPSILSEPVDGPAYWRHELIKFSPDDVIVDGGAFDGDSLRAYMALQDPPHLRRRFAHYIAIEPDMTSCARLAAYVAPYFNVSLIYGALGAAHGGTMVMSTGTVDTRTGTGNVAVPVHTINDLSPDETISMIKLDIEGDEMAALDGAWARIAKDRPTLAVSVYHKPCDLWQIPLAIKAQHPDYRFYLRAHSNEGWDVVVYAVPPERCV